MQPLFVLFAQKGPTPQVDLTGLYLVGGLFLGAVVLIVAIMIASMWKIFDKAGKPGWAAIIPFYNMVVMLEIVGRPIWWLILYFVPLVGIIVVFVVALDLAKSFGKDTVFGLGLIFLPFIFYPMLAFGSARYRPIVSEAM